MSCSRRSSSARSATCCTTSPGTRCATGTWSWPRSRWLGDDPQAAEATRQVLGFVLDQLLRLLHPVMPFVTEELWTALTGEDSVMVAPWPAFSLRDPAAEAEISSLMRLVTEVRRFRSDQGLRPGQRVAARLAGIEDTPLAGHDGPDPVPAAAQPARRGLRRPRPRWPPRASRSSWTWPAPWTSPPSADGWRRTSPRPGARPSSPPASWTTPTSPPRHPPRWWPRPASGWTPPGPTSPGSSSAWPSLGRADLPLPPRPLR